MDSVGELLGLSEVGELALHPDGIGVRCVGDRPVDGTVTAALQTVVTFSGPGRLPIEEDILAEHTSRKLSCLLVALSLALFLVRLLQGVLVTLSGGIDGSEDGIVEALKVRGGEPLVFDTLEFCAGLVGGGGGEHEVVERGKVGVCAAEDESVVAGVDGGCDEGGGFGIGTGDGDEVGALGMLVWFIDSSHLMNRRRRGRESYP